VLKVYRSRIRSAACWCLTAVFTIIFLIGVQGTIEVLAGGRSGPGPSVGAWVFTCLLLGVLLLLVVLGIRGARFGLMSRNDQLISLEMRHTKKIAWNDIRGFAFNKAAQHPLSAQLDDGKAEQLKSVRRSWLRPTRSEERAALIAQSLNAERSARELPAPTL